MNQATTTNLTPQQITALLHLSSPTLPIGGFSYSQGLEAAVELDLVHDESSAQQWIEHQLNFVIARTEAPIWNIFFSAWKTNDTPTLIKWNQWFYASRESHELRQETEQMGTSLYKLAQELGWGNESSHSFLRTLKPITLPCIHAFVCAQNNLPSETALTAYLFTWLENQVAAAIKSIPLGQLAGQRILQRGMQLIPNALAESLERSTSTPPLINAFAPQYALIAARHESQFSRLFRS